MINKVLLVDDDPDEIELLQEAFTIANPLIVCYGAENGLTAINFLRRGSLDVNLSRPLPPNQHTPHAQDEVYIIIRGRGVLLHEGKRESFEAGDFLFVAAGTEHHFVDFSDDVAYWRVFYGPPGGELPP